MSESEDESESAGGGRERGTGTPAGTGVRVSAWSTEHHRGSCNQSTALEAVGRREWEEVTTEIF